MFGPGIGSLVLLTILAVFPASLRAFSPPRECDGKFLELARGAMRAANLRQARDFLDRVKDCDGQLGADARALLEKIDRQEAVFNLWSRAQIALGTGQYDLACELLLEVENLDPGYPGLRAAKARAGGCDAALKALAEKLEQARRLASEKQWSRAQALLEEILREKPDFEDAARLLTEVKAARREEQSRKTDAVSAPRGESRNSPVETRSGAASAGNDSGDRRKFEELCANAERELEGGRHRRAFELGQEAKALIPGDSTADVILARVEAALGREREELESILEDFFRGDYQACIQKCRLFLARPHEAAPDALALFFEANSRLSLATLNNDLSADDRREAGRLIEKAVQRNPGVIYWWKHVSPKLRSLLGPADSGGG